MMLRLLRYVARRRRFRGAGALPNLLVDGDCDAPNTDAWTASSGALSKQTGSPVRGSRCLRITDDDGNGTAYALQGNPLAGITNGESFRATGWARLGGTLGGSAVARVTTDTVTLWSGVAGSTEWARFDVTGTHDDRIYFGGITLGGNTSAYVEIDGVRVWPV